MSSEQYDLLMVVVLTVLVVGLYALSCIVLDEIEGKGKK